jgi:hypothetical protein
VTLDDEQDIFRHVRLHNGTLWRWNRPLIGQVGDQYHLRIEHRVVPAGPSIVDSVANAAMYYGLVQALSQLETAPEHALPFATSRDNFYAAAQKGLECHLTWLNGTKSGAQSLILRYLIPLAWAGLTQLHIDTESIKYYLGIIEKRVENRCNGAAWQEAFVSKYGDNMQTLTRAYLERQNSGLPVHEWDL